MGFFSPSGTVALYKRLIKRLIKSFYHVKKYCILFTRVYWQWGLIEAGCDALPLLPKVEKTAKGKKNVLKKKKKALSVKH